MSDDITQWFLLTQTQLSCSYGAAALIWYEYLLTLDQEIQQIWRRKLSGITVMFFVNRYALLIVSAFLILTQSPLFGVSDKVRFLSRSSLLTRSPRIYPSCAAHIWLEAVFGIVSGTCAAVFYATRTYALYSRQIWFLWLTLGLGLVGPAINSYIWAKMFSTMVFNAGVGEACGFSLDPYMYESLLMGARGSALAADTIVLILTCAETYKIIRFCGGLERSMTLKLMTQEGVVYYIILGALNIVGLTLGRIQVIVALVPLWVAILTSLLISRFVLELRTAYYDSTIMRSTLSFRIRSTLFGWSEEPSEALP